MAVVRVSHGIDDLRSDLAGIPVDLARQAPRVVKRNVDQGTALARKFAIESSGPHGSNYYKRISGELLSPFEGEYGPHAGGTPVGAGYRHGPPNMDLPKSADIQGPKFASDVADLVDRLFW